MSTVDRLLAQGTASNIVADTVHGELEGLRPCLGVARARGELPPGPVTFVLSWTITADGSAAEPQLEGPPAFLNTSVSRCLLTQMMGWKFPLSERGRVVSHFSLPLVVPTSRSQPIKAGW